MITKTHTTCLRNVVRQLANHKPAKSWCGIPLWCVVSKVCCIGSTLASDLCVEFGFDPDMVVAHIEHVDKSHQVVMEFCEECDTTFHGGIMHICESDDNLS